MKRSLLPISRRKHNFNKTLDFHRSFGTVTPAVIPQEFNFDTVGVFPNQESDGLPNACTAYTVTGNASNNDKTNYDDKNFTYTKTKLMMGVEGDVPCDQITAMKSAEEWGVRKKGQGDADALGNRMAPPLIVKKLNGKYFDGLVSAMWKKQGTLNLGSYWPPEAEPVGSDGVVPPFSVPSDWSTGHDYEACGVKVIPTVINGSMNPVQYLIVKSWQGPNFGDKGYIYFNRPQVEALLSTDGAGAFGQLKFSQFDQSQVQQVKFDIVDQIVHFLWQILGKMQAGLGRVFQHV